MAEKEIHVAAGLCFKDGKVLIARRASGGPAPLLWEFPGGKVKPGEAAVEALTRELAEELSLNLRPGRKIGDSRVSSGGNRIFMECFAVPVPSGTFPVRKEHAALAWTTPGEWELYDWAPSDIPLVEDPAFLQAVRELLSEPPAAKTRP